VLKIEMYGCGAETNFVNKFGQKIEE